MTEQITRTPYCTKIRYGIEGAPILDGDDMDGSHAPGVGIRPTLIEFVYSAARDGKPASVSASVTGQWTRFGKREPFDDQVTTHFKGGPDGWPAWLAAEARLHDPDAELNRLRDELAEEKAAHDPRLRGLLVKTAKDRDQYVQWSTVADGPKGVFSRETALEYGFPRSTIDYADEHGSSSRLGDGAWDDKGWVAEQRGWLPRHLIGDYAVEYLHGDRVAAYAMLEPFEDDAEAAR
jgi:hypothetical protein